MASRAEAEEALSASQAEDTLQRHQRGHFDDHAILARSAEVLLKGRAAGSSTTPERVLLAAEQAALSASAAGDSTLARRGADVLTGAFPRSHRTARARGVALEAEGKLSDAEQLYDSTLESDPTDPRLLRRRAVLERSRNRPRNAIKRMCDYLDTYSADVDAWAALGCWYAELLKHSLAIFCFEEVLLSQPQDTRTHSTLAESCYTHGDYAKARHHFAAAVQLSNGNDVRSLFGLVLCGPGGLRENLPQLASSRLLSLYQSKSPSHLPLVRPVIASSKTGDRTESSSASK